MNFNIKPPEELEIPPNMLTVGCGRGSGMLLDVILVAKQTMSRQWRCQVICNIRFWPSVGKARRSGRSDPHNRLVSSIIGACNFNSNHVLKSALVVNY